VFNIGSQELLIIFVLVFLLFGPKHIPEVAQTLGKGLGELRRTLYGVEESVRRTARDLPDPDRMRRSAEREARESAPEGPGGADTRQSTERKDALPADKNPAPRSSSDLEPPGKAES